MKKLFSIIQQFKLIDKNNFDKATLEPKVKVFLIHINSFATQILIYQAKKTKLSLLMIEKVIIFSKIFRYYKCVFENISIGVT